MANFPATGYLSDAGRTKGEMKVAMEDQLQATKQIPGAGLAETTLTIAGGIVTPVGGVHSVDTEAAAVSDDLATIATTNLPDGSMLWIRSVSASRVVTVKHNAGGAGQVTLKAAADLALNNPALWLVVKRTGTGWEEVGQFAATPAVTTILGAPAVRGAVGARASTTTYTVSSASWIAFYRPSTGGIEKTVTSQGTLTVDAGTFARNGRDQSGAFSANTWLYLYYTWDGSTVALRLSTSAPPTGPTLGSGETSFAFICALRWNASSNFIATYLRGRLVSYALQSTVISGGTASTLTSLDLSAVVPPQAACPDIAINIASSGTTAAGPIPVQTDISIDGTNIFSNVALSLTAGVAVIIVTPNCSIPNIGQTIYYRASAGSSSLGYVYVVSYANANGG